MHQSRFSFFFFNDTATTEIYTLSLHDALPIFNAFGPRTRISPMCETSKRPTFCRTQDRKSTRLNSSHSQISYAVFCLKKKKNRKYAMSIIAMNQGVFQVMATNSTPRLSDTDLA